jgi:hypothetical protein
VLGEQSAEPKDRHAQFGHEHARLVGDIDLRNAPREAAASRIAQGG